MVLFGSQLDQFVSCFVSVNVLLNFKLEAVFNRVDWGSSFVFNPKDPRLKIFVEVYDGIV